MERSRAKQAWWGGRGAVCAWDSFCRFRSDARQGSLATVRMHMDTSRAGDRPSLARRCTWCVLGDVVTLCLFPWSQVRALAVSAIAGLLSVLWPVLIDACVVARRLSSPALAIPARGRCVPAGHPRALNNHPQRGWWPVPFMQAAHMQHRHDEHQGRRHMRPDTCAARLHIHS